ncbi:hypothetical protein CRENBAI_012245, partial [Crenichthys baileyi]
MADKQYRKFKTLKKFKHSLLLYCPAEEPDELHLSLSSSSRQPHLVVEKVSLIAMFHSPPCTQQRLNNQPEEFSLLPQTREVLLFQAGGIKGCSDGDRKNRG